MVRNQRRGSVSAHTQRARDDTLARGVLHPGERLLWVGRPERRFFRPESLFAVAFGVVSLCSGSLFLLWRATTPTPHFGPPMAVGIAAVVIGFVVPGSNIYAGLRRRSASTYVLTDSRALVLHRGRSLLIGNCSGLLSAVSSPVAIGSHQAFRRRIGSKCDVE